MYRPGMERFYKADDARYDRMIYRRCGRSGLKLPLVSLGLWHNFGGTTPHETKRAMCLTAFDSGITHFDLANNYGPPHGSAESAFGKILEQDLHPYRDEMVISTKAGYDMWPGPYGEWGSRKYLLASLDQSLARMGLEYVDIFYSHRFDPETPLEETMGALAHAVHSGKALYAGISSYNSQRTREAAELLRDMGVPLLIHQPSYSMINRWIEADELLGTLDDLGTGSIVFSPLAQGMLTSKYLKDIPEQSRVNDNCSLAKSFIKPETMENIRNLNGIAKARGQTLAQMALSWVLRAQEQGQVTTALIGARTPEQILDCVACIDNLDFSDAELAQIDKFAMDAGINLWAPSSEYAGQDGASGA
jgi:L-glyceraldehyde 3-phosphate reductase